jgi:uncharacterized phage protein (TIGR01671 family)
MEEWLFRGKSLETGKWLIGSLFNDGGEDYIIPNELTAALEYEDYQVDQNTIQLYSGFNDKTGKRVFVGDIVKDVERKIYWTCVWDDVYKGIGFVRQNGPVEHYNKEEISKLVVIGNVLDVEITLNLV